MFTTTACLGLARSVVNLDLCFYLGFAITLQNVFLSDNFANLDLFVICLPESAKRFACESSVRYGSVFHESAIN